MPESKGLKDGFNLFHHGEETLILEKNDDVVSASLEPVHVFNVDRGIAFTGTMYAADYLGLNPITIRNYVDKGVLPARRLPSGHRRIRVDSLKELRNQMHSQGDDLALELEESAVEIHPVEDMLELHVNPAARSEIATSKGASLSLGKISGNQTVEIAEITIVESVPDGLVEVSVDQIVAASENGHGVVFWVREPASSEIGKKELFTRIVPEAPLNILEGAVSLDLNKGCLLVDGQEVHLQNMTREVIHYLAVNKGITLSHDQIVNAVWGERYGSSNVLAVQIGYARKAFGNYHGLIKTARGIGYRLDPDNLKNT